MISLGNFGLSGEYRVLVSSDIECKDTSIDLSFPNLITNNGLNMIGADHGYGSSGGVLSRFCVGSSTIPPSVYDTSLKSIVAYATTSATVVSSTSSYDDGYVDIVMTYRFDKGAAAGNLSEIGIGVSQTQLFSRALILDGSGNPTTITVLPNEFLTVFYTLRCNIPKTDATFSIMADVDGVPTATTVVVRPVSADTRATNPSEIAWGFGISTGDTVASPSGLIPATSRPPTFGIVSAGAHELQPYVENSFERWSTILSSINQGNLPGGLIKTLFYRLQIGAWQMEFTPAIAKNDTKTASFTVGYSWARA